MKAHYPIAPNLLQDRAPAQAIDEIWRTDITYAR